MKHKSFIIRTFAAIFTALLLFGGTALYAQDTTDSIPEQPEKKEKDNRPQRAAFDSEYLINQATTTIPQAKTVTFMIQHRFGTLGSESFDMFGLYAPSNIRLGVSYSLTDYLQVGIGSTKLNKMQDLNWKLTALRQTRSNSIPVTVSYTGNVAVDVRGDIFPAFNNRLSYFHQLIIARRFNSALSLQIAANYSHYNILDSSEFSGLKHDNIGGSIGGRYKLSPQSSILFEYGMSFTAPEKIKPNAAIGWEIATSGHAFQIFLSTYSAILPQADYTFNTNDFTDKGILLGFNITRLWGF